MTTDQAGSGLSVVIPTHLPRSLDRTLQALSRQTDPGFEVIVVENGTGSDAAAALCRQWMSHLNIRYRFDPTAGLNRARNTGTRMAAGRFVALLDDDCMPARSWTESVLAGFGRFPNAGVIGGPVVLELASPTPDWLAGEFRTCLSELDRGPEAKALKEGEYLFGANMAFPRTTFETVGGFPEDIGMSTREPPQLANDEIAFLDAVSRQCGGGLVYCPDMSVAHHIPPERLSLAHMFQRRYGQGVSDVALLDWRHGPDTEKVLERYLNSVFPHLWHRQQLDGVLQGLETKAAERYLRYHVVCRTAYLCGYRQAMSQSPHTRPDTLLPTRNGGVTQGNRSTSLVRRIEHLMADKPAQGVVSAASDLLYRGVRPGAARTLKQADSRLRLLITVANFLEPGLFDALSFNPGKGAAPAPRHGAPTPRIPGQEFHRSRGPSRETSRCG